LQVLGVTQEKAGDSEKEDDSQSGRTSVGVLQHNRLNHHACQIPDKLAALDRVLKGHLFNPVRLCASVAGDQGKAANAEK
jgi:hypothetical protein